MSKLHLLIFLVLLVALTNVESVIGIPTGGCPLFENLCIKFCKKFRFGKKGRCIGPTKGRCKCIR
uniref:Knottin scorpion toxin-like domain-containing protein n=1 Tax=Isometrus maculatus TaxID=497827 RepID=A0A0U1TZG6_ISOMC|nr:hypothetical protein [Isometrus maculatus]